MYVSQGRVFELVITGDRSDCPVFGYQRLTNMFTVQFQFTESSSILLNLVSSLSTRPSDMVVGFIQSLFYCRSSTLN